MEVEYREPYLVHQSSVSTVEVVHSPSCDIMFVIETIPKTVLKSDRRLARNKNNERLVASSVRHPNVMRLVDVAQTDNAILFAYEYCGRGSIEELIMKKSRFHLFYVFNYLLQILEGLYKLNKAEFVHLNINNRLLLIRDTQVKIGGLEYCFRKDKISKNLDLDYSVKIAPEVFSNGDISSRSTIWSLGVVLFEMMNGVLMKEHKDHDLLEKYINGSFHKNELNPNNDPTSYINHIISRMIKMDQHSRINIDELLKERPKISMMMDRSSPLKVYNTLNTIERVYDPVHLAMEDFNLNKRMKDLEILVEQNYENNILSEAASSYHINLKRLKGKFISYVMKKTQSSFAHYHLKEVPPVMNSLAWFVTTISKDIIVSLDMLIDENQETQRLRELCIIDINSMSVHLSSESSQTSLQETIHEYVRSYTEQST